MKKNLSAFAHLFEADTGMDRRDPYVSAWSDSLVQTNKHRNRKFVSTDVDNWFKTMQDEACNLDESVTVDVDLDSHNDLFCVTMTDAAGTCEFCVPPPRNPKTKKEKLIMRVINDGPEAHEAFRKTLVEALGLGASGKEAVTESDRHKERIADSVEHDDDMSDGEIEDMARKLDKAASAANNDRAAYLIELAASRLRELKNG